MLRRFPGEERGAVAGWDRWHKGRK
jgi:hypothetical protein